MNIIPNKQDQISSFYQKSEVNQFEFKTPHNIILVPHKDLIVEDKQGIEQVLKADNCQKHTSFADNFIFLELVARKQTADGCHKQTILFFKLVTRKQTEHEQLSKKDSH